MDNNTLSKFVKTIGDKAVKERRKTNHNARKTTVTLLVNAVVPPIYPSFANKRSQKRPVLYIINNYSYASKEQLNRCQKSFLCRYWKLRYFNRLREFIWIIIILLQMPAKSYLRMYRKKLKMIKILKWPNFVKVITK